MRKFLLLCTLCGLFSVGYTTFDSEAGAGANETKPKTENIVFADAVVKAACVSAFDTNGDGELSYEEAANVTSIPSKFFGENIDKVNTFNELQHFTNLQVIKDKAFYGISPLSQIIIPESVIHIGSEAFSLTNIVSIVIPDSVKTIGHDAFYTCWHLDNIVLSKNITSIANFAFGNTDIQYVTIPEGITSIGRGAFKNCDRLVEVTIPSSVTAIGEEAFANCEGLKTIYCKPTTPPTLDNIYNKNYTICNEIGLFGQAKRYFKIYVPKESVKAYKKDRNWKHYSKNIEGYDFK